MLDIIITGLLSGTLYAPLVVSFNMIYRSSRVLNFAHGDLMALGAYLAYAMMVALSAYSQQPILAVAASVVIAGLVGILIERSVLRPLLGQPVATMVLVTIGLSSIIQGVVQMVWGPAPLPITQLIPVGTIEIGSVSISLTLIYSSLVSLALLAALLLFYYRTKIGIAMRAVANDQVAAIALGVNVSLVFMLTWFLASSIASISGILLANIYGFVSLALTTIILKVFAAAILGGLDSIVGAMVGALIIGLFDAVGGILEPMVAPGFKDVLPLVAALIFMLLRPYGLFGTERIERV